MYHLRFYRTIHNLNAGANHIPTFKQDSGYGVYVNGIEYAIARAWDGNGWDVTEVSTGMRMDSGYEIFPTRDSALAWLRKYVEETDVQSKLVKYKSIQRALAEYKKPLEVKTHEQVGDITLTIKQTDFLQRYKKEIGLRDFPSKEISARIGISPMSVGAQISTLVEKGILSTYMEGQIRKVKITETGLKIMEEV